MIVPSAKDFALIREAEFDLNHAAGLSDLGQLVSDLWDTSRRKSMSPHQAAVAGLAFRLLSEAHSIIGAEVARLTELEAQRLADERAGLEAA